MASDNMQEIFPERAFTHKLPLQATEGFPVCMIITPPLPAKPVDKVIFIIKSHDQGWCSQDNFPGVYPGSWTWFEAMILRPVGGGDDWISLYWAKRGISSEPSVASALAKLAGLDKPPPKEQAILCFVPNPKRPPCHSWHVQKNRRGNSKPKEHMVIWDKTGKQSRMERLGCEFDTDTGASSGIGFVNLLQEGDRIVLIACAKKYGSVNYVAEAEVRLEFDESEATPPTTPSAANDPPAPQNRERLFTPNLRRLRKWCASLVCTTHGTTPTD